jgi:hypothetical protein
LIIQDGLPSEGEQALIAVWKMLGTPFRLVNITSAEPRPTPPAFKATPMAKPFDEQPQRTPPTGPQMIQGPDGGYIMAPNQA